MTRRLKPIVLVLAALAALALGGTAFAVAATQGGGPASAQERPGDAREDGDDDGGRDDDAGDRPVSGDVADRARAAAEAKAGGRASEVEAADEPGAAYEVEVEKAGDEEVDVLLDERLGVVRVGADD
jgi:uncharacterized membrane protein YkoI